MKIHNKTKATAGAYYQVCNKDTTMLRAILTNYHSNVVVMMMFK